MVGELGRPVFTLIPEIVMVGELGRPVFTLIPGDSYGR